MNTTTMNPVTRIGRLILNDIMTEGRGLLVAAASFAAVVVLFFGVLIGGDLNGEFPPFLFHALLLIGGFMYASRALVALHRRDRAIDYLMLPATLAEKLISRVLQSTVLYTAGAAVLCVLTSRSESSQRSR